jgi:hypothetical protein
LTRATVAAEDGSSVLSEHRQANQASYNLHQVNPESDPLWPLFARTMSFTNSYTGMNLQPDGQEDFTIIQYNVNDQYTLVKLLIYPLNLDSFIDFLYLIISNYSSRDCL